MVDVDVRVFEWLHALLGRSPYVLSLMAAFTILGSGWTMLALLPLLVARRTRRFAAALTATLLTTAAIVFVLKLLVRRVRPFGHIEGVRALVFAAPTDYSFPSGHSAGSFAFAAFFSAALLRAGVWRDKPPLRVLLVLVLFTAALGVGASRVALGVHFPGDVLAGGAIGTVVGLVGARATAQERLRS